MAASTPFELVAAASAVRLAPKEELVLRVRALEHDALLAPLPTSAYVCLQDGRFLTARTRAFYARLASAGVPVRLYAQGLQAWLGPGLEGVDLDEGNPLADQWTLLLTGAEPLCFAAQDLAWPARGDRYRDFQWSQSSDPDVVLAVARLLDSHVPAPRS